jgi:formylglycine-generating enzyme required for sulfatase activity
MERSVFISYSSSDKAVADQICAALEGSGFGCWIAPRDIEPGADYPAAILDGLQQARTVVVVVSPASVASPHILTEVGHAFSKKKSIIPFRLSATQLPPDFDYFLSMSQWLDAYDGLTPENLARLKEAVSQAHPVRASGVAAKTGLDKRILMAGAMVLMAVAAVAVWRWPSAKSGFNDGHSTDGKLRPPVDAKKGSDEKGNPPDSKPQPWVNPKDGLTYVWIPPGQFNMGCSAGDTECKPEEAPNHLVELPAGFWIGQTEVTNAAYHRVVSSASFSPIEANLPAVGISWSEAKSYCAAVGGRLPTEAEWEYAARGGATTAYYGVPSKIAWFADNSGGDRHAVATRQPNAYGLYDMLGNASEWVLDRYYNKYDIEAPAIGNVEQPLASNASALTRGGFWESEAANIRVSHRIAMDNRDPAPMAGIRCVLDRK